MKISRRSLESLKRAHEQLVAETQRAEQQALEFAGRFALDHVNKYPAFQPRTGALQAATKFRVVRLGSGRLLKLTNTKAYAAPIDLGARPHVILPKRARFLVFRGRDGGLVFARKVNHPGNRPYKFLYRAHSAAGRVFYRNLQSRMAEIARRFSASKGT